MSNILQIIILALVSLFSYLWQNSNDVFFRKQALILRRVMIIIFAFLLFVLAAKFKAEQEKDMNSLRVREERRKVRKF